MKNTKRYLSIFLALALAAPVFTGCDNGLDEYKSGETIAPPFGQVQSRNPVRIASDRRSAGRQRCGLRRHRQLHGQYARRPRQVVADGAGPRRRRQPAQNNADGPQHQALDGVRIQPYRQQELLSGQHALFQRSHDRGQGHSLRFGMLRHRFRTDAQRHPHRQGRGRQRHGNDQRIIRHQLQHGAFRKCRPDQRFRRQERRADADSTTRSRTC